MGMGVGSLYSDLYGKNNTLNITKLSKANEGIGPWSNPPNYLLYLFLFTLYGHLKIFMLSKMSFCPIPQAFDIPKAVGSIERK